MEIILKFCSKYKDFKVISRDLKPLSKMEVTSDSKSKGSMNKTKDWKKGQCSWSMLRTMVPLRISRKLKSVRNSRSTSVRKRRTRISFSRILKGSRKNTWPWKLRTMNWNRDSGEAVSSILHDLLVTIRDSQDKVLSSSSTKISWMRWIQLWSEWFCYFHILQCSYTHKLINSRKDPKE